MRYIICEHPGKLSIKNTSHPTPQHNEVMLKIKRIGICGTDLHAFAGNQAYFTYPRILGHELAAEIEDPNGLGALATGEKVAIIPYLHCGRCLACRSGKTNCCASLKVIGVHTDGGMQESIALPQAAIIPTPHLEWEEIAIIEPLAVAAHAVRRADIKKGEKVLVMGCGPIGLAIMVFAQLAGAEVTALDLNALRLGLAKTAFGADHIVNAGGDNLKTFQELTGGDLFHTVIDATGSKIAMENGPSYMGHGGKYILVGLYKSNLEFNHPALHAKETSLLCSRNATREDFHKVIDILSTKKFPVSKYITHRVPFGDLTENFKSWTDPASQTIKAMITL